MSEMRTGTPPVLATMMREKSDGFSTRPSVRTLGRNAIAPLERAATTAAISSVSPAPIAAAAGPASASPSGRTTIEPISS
jgi:hypothetical protein